MNVKSICNVRSFTHLQIKKNRNLLQKKNKNHRGAFTALSKSENVTFYKTFPVNFFRKKILLFMYLFPISFALALKQESST